MADTKITALTALTAADPANDVIPIVDVSDTTMAASGTTKKISVNNILGASGTATLASATITGAATVGTTLGVTGQSTLTGSVGIGGSPVANTRLYTRTALATDRGFASDNNLNADFVVQYASGLTTIGAELNVPLAFKTNNIERMRLTGGNLSLANGNVVMTTSGTGIDFSATANSSGTMTSELLNDYEEGTWTGTLTGGGANPTIPVTTTGRYTKIGRQVYVTINFNLVTTTGASGGVSITGLPFANNASNTAQGSILSSDTLTFTGSPIAFLELNATALNIYQILSNAAVVFCAHNAGVARYMQATITYTV